MTGTPPLFAALGGDENRGNAWVLAPLESWDKTDVNNKDSVSPRSGLSRFLWVSGNPLIRLDMTGTLTHFMFS